MSYLPSQADSRCLPDTASMRFTRLLLGLLALNGSPMAAEQTCDSPLATVTRGPQPSADGELEGALWNLSQPTEAGGVSVTISEIGGTIVSLTAPDRDGNLADVVLGFDSVDSYTVPGPYFGAIVGRVANRIAGGKFVLDGEEYTLATNNGPNCLHGGNVGFDKLRWSGVEVPGGVELTLTSPDGDEGFPGTVVVVATYTLETGGKVLLDMSATSDAPTPIALAQHSYFNLRGHDAGASVHGHTVHIDAETYTPVDADLIPTGVLQPVGDGSGSMDLRKPTELGPAIAKLEAEAKAAGVSDEDLSFVGFDHNYCLAKGATEALAFAARVEEPVSGRVMTVETTAPGVQFYTANYVNGEVGKGGVAYAKQGGLCLETQHYPSGIGEPNAPLFGEGATPILRPGETYRHAVSYAFTTAE